MKPKNPLLKSTFTLTADEPAIPGDVRLDKRHCKWTCLAAGGAYVLVQQTACFPQAWSLRRWQEMVKEC
jgi:hypothetical protein